MIQLQTLSKGPLDRIFVLISEPFKSVSTCTWVHYSPVAERSYPFLTAVDVFQLGFVRGT